MYSMFLRVTIVHSFECLHDYSETTIAHSPECFGKRASFFEYLHTYLQYRLRKISAATRFDESLALTSFY